MHNDFTESTHVEPVVGEVLALRSFNIDTTTWTLGGLTFHQEIAPGVNLAQCAHTNTSDAEHQAHIAPVPGCTCGWYAYDEVRHWNGPSTPRWPTGQEVFAVVRLSGKIIVCERGLKAEEMEVLAVAVDPAYTALIHSVLPDVKVFLDEESMLEQYPLQRLSRGEDEGEEMGGSKDPTVLGLTIPVSATAHSITQADYHLQSGFLDRLGRCDVVSEEDHHSGHLGFRHLVCA